MANGFLQFHDVGKGKLYPRRAAEAAGVKRGFGQAGPHRNDHPWGIPHRLLTSMRLFVAGSFESQAEVPPENGDIYRAKGIGTAQSLV